MVPTSEGAAFAAGGGKSVSFAVDPVSGLCQQGPPQDTPLHREGTVSDGYTENSLFRHNLFVEGSSSALDSSTWSDLAATDHRGGGDCCEDGLCSTVGEADGCSKAVYTPPVYARAQRAADSQGGVVSDWRSVRSGGVEGGGRTDESCSTPQRRGCGECRAGCEGGAGRRRGVGGLLRVCTLGADSGHNDPGGSSAAGGSTHGVLRELRARRPSSFRPRAPPGS
ncbi:unnamed protein product [Pedinophyceae sp. YPF-701]|nr:unnamed protein product [Pedinophyceae sp. YPF-701]